MVVKVKGEFVWHVRLRVLLGWGKGGKGGWSSVRVSGQERGLSEFAMMATKTRSVRRPTYKE